MLTLVLVVVILLVVAYFAYTLLPHPFGLIVCGIIVIIALFYLVGAVGEDGEKLGVVLLH